MDSKNRTETQTLDLRKNGPLGKTKPQGLKTLSSFSSNTKDNIKVIHFHIKSRGVQDLVFVQITFENCPLKFYFGNSGIGIKKTIANLHPLLAWNVSACLRIFMHCVFMKLAMFLISSTESSMKIKVRSHWTFFLIILISAVICK